MENDSRLLAGSSATLTCQAASPRLVHYPGLGWFEPHQVDFSVWTLIIGLTFITVARVMRLGVTMREELDVTA